MIVASQIIGRTLCIELQRTATARLANRQRRPAPLTNGPLFGQDGLRVTAGSYGDVDSSLISQNLVHGTGAPVAQQRRPTTPTSRWAPASAPAIGADATGSSSIAAQQHRRQRLRRDQRRPRRHDRQRRRPVERPRTTGGACARRSATTGAACQPRRQPPTPARRSRRRPTRPLPENPVNGTATPTARATTSNSVDFFPYRNGPQSDPNTGEFPVLTAPIPVNDAAPTVDLRGAARAYRRGDDDHADRRRRATTSASSDVRFIDGATDARHGDARRRTGQRTRSRPTRPAAPARSPPRPTDSLGQTGSADDVAVDRRLRRLPPGPTPGHRHRPAARRPARSRPRGTARDRGPAPAPTVSLPVPQRRSRASARRRRRVAPVPAGRRQRRRLPRRPPGLHADRRRRSPARSRRRGADVGRSRCARSSPTSPARRARDQPQRRRAASSRPRPELEVSHEAAQGRQARGRSPARSLPAQRHAGAGLHERLASRSSSSAAAARDQLSRSALDQALHRSSRSVTAPRTQAAAFSASVRVRRQRPS